MAKSWVITIVLSIAMVTTRSAYFILSPLFLDALVGHNSTEQNASTPNGSAPHDTSRGISLSFFIIFQWGFNTACMGTLLLITWIIRPESIGTLERSLPKSQLAKTGIAMGISSILYNYPGSGSRTPPYLLGILVNFYIPIQFITRFILLRKKTTLVQLICAIVILIAEFICLLPVIFPSLESSSAKHDDGGSKGLGRILWPLCLIVSLVPFALSNTLQERAVQKQANKQIEQQMLDQTEEQSRTPSKPQRINLIYYLFWYFLFVFLTTLALFWLDIMPHFGTCDSFKTFIERVRFDTACLFGINECPAQAVVVGWLDFTLALLAGTFIPALMRYSDGANYVAIALTLRTPTVLLFWSLFIEQPFMWRPHIHLSTWLSFGALALMLPSVVLYETGDSLIKNLRWCKRRDDRELLVNEEEPTDLSNEHTID